MNTLAEQERLINFQKRLRLAITRDVGTIDTSDPYVMRTIDYLLCSETNIRPLREEIK